MEAEELILRMKRLSTLTTDPDGVEKHLLALAEMEKLSKEAGLSKRELQIRALKAHILPEKYLRSFGTVGWEGQLKLARAKVAVIGLGGLGGSIAEGLARLGVGRLALMDGDTFAEHNLNRQLFSTEATLGRPKTGVAQKRLASVNSYIQVEAYPEYATRENLPGVLAGAQVVMDALDRLPQRLMLQDVAQELGIPMVHGAIAGMVGQVMTIFPNDAGLRAFYRVEDLPEQGAEVRLGCPTATPMMVAAWQVQEALKIITGCGEPIRNRILFMDAQSGRVDSLQFGAR